MSLAAALRFPILLVEDNPDDAELTRIALQEMGGPGFRLVRVASVADAIDRLAEEDFGALLLDLHLPDASGLETWEEIREHAADVPTVVLTSTDDEELGARLIELGAQDYLVKGKVGGEGFTRSILHARQRHRSERDLRSARAEALQAARAKSDFLAAMSHEIRTPLNAVLGMTDILLDSDLDPEQERYVRMCRNAGETLLELINGILDLSKIEAGHLELETARFDVAELVESTLEILAFPAHKKRLAFACEIARDFPRERLGDAARLRQVLLNLVGNAIKFTEEGEVVVGVGRAPEPAAGDGLCVAIRDTGIGIPPEKQQAIFDSFSQGDGSITRRFGGSGLGLALSRRLVELMGGTLSVESEPGRGSAFRFTLPLPVAPGAGPPAPLPRFDAPRRALVAAKHACEGRILGDLLRETGCTVEEASTTEQAHLAAARAREEGIPFQVLLLDCRLPESGGFALVDSLRRDGTLPEQTVLLLTADHRGGDVGRCGELGLSGWLVKPVRTPRLMELLLGDEPAAGATAGAARAAPVARSLRILLVDDSEDNRALVSAYLRHTPHTVALAEDGAAAVERFQEGGFDLVLMDMQMPVMDGCRATRAIRAWEASSGRPRTPILALSAYAFSEEKERSLDAGCDAHLTKPIRKQALLEAIGRWGAPSDARQPIVVSVDEDLRDLVDDFVENRRRDVGRLREAIEAADFEEVRRLGHNMKGTGINYGFQGVTDLGKELEDAGRERDAGRARAAMDALADYLERVQTH